MVGTTLYEELIYKGKTYQGGDAVETQTVVAALAGGEGFKTQAQLERFMSIGEPPISSDEFVKRIPVPVTDFFYGTDFTLEVHQRTEQTTKAFGRQMVFLIDEFRKKDISKHNNLSWTSRLKTDFAPALGFPLKQHYTDTGRLNVTCDLASIDGPGGATSPWGRLQGAISRR